MEQSPWEVNTFSASKIIFSMLWNQKIHQRNDKSPPIVPFLSQMYPVHTLSFCSYKIHFNISLPSKSRSSKWFLSFRIYNKISVRISFYSHTRYMSRSPHPPWIYHVNNIWHGAHITLFWHTLSLYGSLKPEGWLVNSWFRSYKFLGLLNCFPSSNILKIFQIRKVNTKFQKMDEFLPTDKRRRGSGVPRNFFSVGEGFNIFRWGQKERGSGDGSPLVRGSGGSCNLVQEI